MILSLTFFGSLGTLFIKNIGGTDSQSLLVGSLTGLMPFVRIPTAILVPATRGKTFLLASFALSSIFFLFTILLPLWRPLTPLTATFVLLSMAGGLALLESGKTFWWPLLHDIVPESQRGSFFAKLRSIWGLVAFLAILGAGTYLGDQPRLLDFQTVLGAILFLYILRILFFSYLPTRPQFRQSHSFQDWKISFSKVFKRPKVFRIFALFCLYSFGQSFFYQPYILYLDHLNIPIGSNVLMHGFKIFGLVIAMAIAGPRIHRFGTGKVFAFGFLGLSALSFLVPILGMHPSSLQKPLMIGVLTLSGAIQAVVDLAFTTDVFKFAPPRGRAFFTSSASLLFHLTHSFGPFFCAILLQWISPHASIQLGAMSLGFYEVVFLSVSLFSLLSFLIFKIKQK